MKLRRLFALLTLAVAACVAVFAAEPEVQPVRWRTIIKTTGANTGTVTFRALLAPGWHLYGLDIPKGGPKATSFDLSGCEGVKFDGKLTPARKALKVNDPLFGMTLTWWDANIDFTVPFTVTDAAKARITAKITYMACDGTSCRPPATENISTPVKLKKQ